MVTYGGFVHSLTTIILRVLLWLAYLIFRVRFYKAKLEPIVDSEDVEQIPQKPLSSLSLATALDPKSPVTKLIKLVDDESYIIRRALVRNPTLPREHLERLREDDDPRVRGEVEKRYPKLNGVDQN